MVIARPPTESCCGPVYSLQQRQPEIAALSARGCVSNEPASDSPTVDALTVPGAATSGEWRKR